MKLLGLVINKGVGMIDYLRQMFHYMNTEEACNYGFTHYGSFYGIPVYLTEGGTPMISVKFGLMEYVMDFAEIVKNCLNIEGVEIKYKGKL